MKYISVANPVKGIWSEMDNLANRVFGGWDAALSGYWPKVDVLEREDAYVLEAELPGYKDSEVDVKVKDNLLTLSSVKVEEEKDAASTAEVNYLIRERAVGGFSRSFKLPRDVDNDSIEGTFKNGILTLTLKRRPEVQPKSITIRAE